MKNIENILMFKKCIRLCALRIGTTINFTELATSCGVSVSTIKSWLGLLEASFIIFFLSPYHSNLGKRIIKSPKLYFYDVGLATTLMNIDKKTILRKRDLYGALFENMMITDFVKNLNAHALKPTLSFFRDNNQNEVDCIIELHGKTVAIEIKASETITSTFFKTPLWFQKQIGSKEKPIILYGGNQKQKRSQVDVIPWTKSYTILTSRLELDSKA